MTPTLQSHYLNLILVQKIEEALEFAKINNIDPLCDNNYLLFKVVYWDKAKFLPLLSELGILSEYGAKGDNTTLPLLCITKGASQCLDWLAKENLILSLDLKQKDNLHIVVSLVQSLMEYKCNKLNMSQSDEEHKGVHATFDSALTSVFSHPTMQPEQSKSIISFFNSRIVRSKNTAKPIRADGSHFIYSHSLTLDDLEVMLESWFLSMQLTPAPSKSNLFKV